MEYKALNLEVDSISKEKGTAVIAHAVYNNIDLVDDIARRGMFTKTWKEKKSADGVYDVSFYVNHDDTQAAGKVTSLFDNEEKAFTGIKAGTHTLGRDTLIMMDEGVIRKASFGFVATKATRIKKEAKQIRELKEVDHLETSVLTRLSANPMAGIVKVNKHFTGMVLDIKALANEEQAFLRSYLSNQQDNLEKLVRFSGSLDPSSDLYTSTQYWIGRCADHMSDMKSQLKYNVKDYLIGTEVKERVDTLRKFIRNTSASDDAIIDAAVELKSLEESLISDTDSTRQDAGEPVSSADRESKELADAFFLLTIKHF